MENISSEQIRQILISLFVLVVSIAFHEFGHAFMADRLGDDTPRRQGRVTLNPVAHADPIGTLALPLLGGLFAAAGGAVGGFGWGRPVQWQPHRIRQGINMSTAKILVSVAGPFMNLVLAFVFALAHVLFVHFEVITPMGTTGGILQYAVATNFILMFFNLLPLPPLDGGHVAQQFVPYRKRAAADELFKYAPFIILGIMLIPQVQRIFLAPAIWCTQHLYQAFLALVA